MEVQHRLSCRHRALLEAALSPWHCRAHCLVPHNTHVLQQLAGTRPGTAALAGNWLWWVDLGQLTIKIDLDS